MRSRLFLRLLPLLILAALIFSTATVSEAFQGKTFEGEWTLTITRPISPDGQKETFTADSTFPLPTDFDFQKPAFWAHCALLSSSGMSSA